MNSVWLYSRQRSDFAALQEQFADMERYAAENSMTVAGQSYDLYDGPLRRRVGLQQCLDHVRAGDVQTVLVTRLSNISHNNRMVLHFLYKLQDNHVKLRTTYDQLLYELHDRGLERPLRIRAARKDGFIPW